MSRRTVPAWSACSRSGAGTEDRGLTKILLPRERVDAEIARAPELTVPCTTQRGAPHGDLSRADPLCCWQERCNHLRFMR
jgi:hypothetical protein